MNELRLTAELFAKLSQVGVRSVTLTQAAADALSDSLKGVYIPTAELSADSRFMGKLCGVTFYRERA